MAWIALITWLTVALLVVAMGLVGRARGIHNVQAPATTGHPAFERAFRAQMNTIEQALMFLPLLWLSGHFGNPQLAAAFGALWLLGRVMYLVGYLAAAEKRSLGFLVGAIALLCLQVQSAIGIFQALR